MQTYTKIIYVLVDYKTGNASLGYPEVYFGKSVQLPLYMKVQKENGYLPAAMFIYPYKYKWVCKPEDNMFKGFALNDEAITRAIDDYEVTSDVYNFGNKITKRGGSTGLLSYEETDRLLGYVTELVKLALAEIREGYVYPSPYKGACVNCEYSPLCGKKKERVTSGAKKRNVCGEEAENE